MSLLLHSRVRTPYTLDPGPHRTGPFRGRITQCTKTLRMSPTTVPERATREPPTTPNLFPIFVAYVLILEVY